MNQIALAKQHLINPNGFGKFIGRSQKSAMADILRGEEREWMAKTIIDLVERIDKMPKTYEQNGKGNDAIVYLHYFKRSADFWITEKDREDQTPQAYGKADLFGDGGEMGYISIDELVENNVELDLHWLPKTLKEITEVSA